MRRSGCIGQCSPTWTPWPPPPLDGQVRRLLPRHAPTSCGVACWTPWVRVSTKRTSTVKIVSRFMAFPTWARVAAATAGAGHGPQAHLDPGRHGRRRRAQSATVPRDRGEGGGRRAEGRGRGRGSARRGEGRRGPIQRRIRTDSPSHSLQQYIRDAAAAFQAARVKLAFAIVDGELEEVSAAVTAVTEALDGLVASAKDAS